MERCRSENVSYGYEAVRIVVRATHGLKVAVALAEEPVSAPVSLGQRGFSPCQRALSHGPQRSGQCICKNQTQERNATLV